MRQAAIGTALAWALVVAAAGLAPAAQPAAPARENVTVTILGIKASSEAAPYVDPALAPVADELRARSARYNSFRRLDSPTKIVPVGGEIEVSLPENYVLRVQVEKAAADTVQLVVSWLRLEKDGRSQPKSRVQMTVRKGKFFLSGGWDLKDGALWGAVAAQ